MNTRDKSFTRASIQRRMEQVEASIDRYLSALATADRHDSEIAQRILVIHSLDDLKEKLAKVIFLILIVRYFEYALDTDIATPRDLLSLAAGIVFIAIAIWFTKPRDKP